VKARPRTPTVCASCGRDDLHACLVEAFIDDEPCHWIATNPDRTRGICSAVRCLKHLARFKRGDHSLTPAARARQARINRRHSPREGRRA